ncbi:uncharacterized protein [Taeniopygia guttata]|uniref:uncharacterized protein n=1 Tax=Taeniopygia guttata TaxID=59729 RepID=UPI003BB8702E
MTLKRHQNDTTAIPDVSFAITFAVPSSSAGCPLPGVAEELKEGWAGAPRTASFLYFTLNVPPVTFSASLGHRGVNGREAPLPPGSHPASIPGFQPRRRLRDQRITPGPAALAPHSHPCRGEDPLDPGGVSRSGIAAPRCTWEPSLLPPVPLSPPGAPLPVHSLFFIPHPVYFQTISPQIHHRAGKAKLRNGKKTTPSDPPRRRLGAAERRSPPKVTPGPKPKPRRWPPTHPPSVSPSPGAAVTACHPPPQLPAHLARLADKRPGGFGAVTAGGVCPCRLGRGQGQQDPPATLTLRAGGGGQSPSPFARPAPSQPHSPRSPSSSSSSSSSSLSSLLPSLPNPPPPHSSLVATTCHPPEHFNGIESLPGPPRQSPSAGTERELGSALEALPGLAARPRGQGGSAAPAPPGSSNSKRKNRRIQPALGHERK